MIALGVALVTLSACARGAGTSFRSGDRPHTVTLARDDRTRAELDLVSGAAAVTVRSADLGGDLVRASTPADSAVRPVLRDDGPARLFLVSSGRGGPADLRVLLSSQVTWRLVFAGGSDEIAVDMRGGRFGGADFAAGSARITMRLPRPGAQAGVVLAGGATQVRAALPAGVPARLRLAGGASTATIGGRSYTGIAAGTTLATPGWGSAPVRYDFDAPAGISQITIASAAAPASLPAQQARAGE
jgi:hypothetical protein